jgi:hypothetical protein
MAWQKGSIILRMSALTYSLFDKQKIVVFTHKLLYILIILKISQYAVKCVYVETWTYFWRLKSPIVLITCAGPLMKISYISTRRRNMLKYVKSSATTIQECRTPNEYSFCHFILEMG